MGKPKRDLSQDQAVTLTWGGGRGTDLAGRWCHGARSWRGRSQTDSACAGVGTGDEEDGLGDCRRGLLKFEGAYGEVSEAERTEMRLGEERLP